MAFIMNKDINESDLKEAFNTYDKDKDGKFNINEFLLACINGLLTKLNYNNIIAIINN